MQWEEKTTHYFVFLNLTGTQGESLVIQDEYRKILNWIQIQIDHNTNMPVFPLVYSIGFWMMENCYFSILFWTMDVNTKIIKEKEYWNSWNVPQRHILSFITKKEYGFKKKTTEYNIQCLELHDIPFILEYKYSLWGKLFWIEICKLIHHWENRQLKENTLGDIYRMYNWFEH